MGNDHPIGQLLQELTKNLVLPENVCLFKFTYELNAFKNYLWKELSETSVHASLDITQVYERP